MSFVQWKDEYSVRIPEIDLQHRRLVDLINQLHDAMKAGSDRAKVGGVVDQLLSYTNYHFAYEERMMEHAHYPALDDHKRVHRAMTAQVEEFRKHVAGAGASLPLTLMSFLKNWLFKHILETDMRYSAHITGNKAA